MTASPPAHRLLAGSFPALEPRFLAAVDERKRPDPLAPVEVLAGSNLLSVYLRRRVAEERGAAVNLRFVTFLDLAREMAAGADPRPPLPALGPFRLARRALAEAPEAALFGPLRDRASLAGALRATWSDLREAGVPRPWREVLPRAASFDDRRALLGAVGATLDRLADLASAFSDPDALLERAAADGSSSSAEPLLVYGVWDLGGTRARLLARLARTRPVTAFVPGDGEGRNGDDDLPRGPELFAHLLGTAPERVAAEAGEAETAGVLAPSETAEAREVVRELLRAVEGGTPLHRCAVLLRHPERQEAAIVAELRLRGLPYFRPAGAGFSRTPAARAALALARLAAEDAPRDAFDTLADLLEALGTLPGGLSAASLSRTLSRAAWFGGRDALATRLARLRGKAGRDGEGARDFAKRILAALPPDAPGSWEEHAARLESLFAGFLGKAARPLTPALEALAALGAVEPGAGIPLAEAAALLPEALDLAALPQGRFEKDGVALLSLVSARGLLFDELLVPGLAEGAFPAPPRPDPLLLDREREALRALTGAPLPPRAGLRHLSGERFLIDVAREAARRRFVALAPTRDENDREKLPSPFFLGLPRLRGVASADLKDPERAARRGVRRVPLGRVPADAVALDADEALRAALEVRPSLVRSPLAPPAVAASVARGALRRAPRFSAYEGRLGRRTTVLSLEGRVLSATLLEGLATCAYRTLLTKGLKLEEKQAPVPPLVPDANELGGLAHEVLARLTRELVEHGRSFTWQPDALDARAGALSAEALARWADAAGTAPPPVLLDRTAAHLATLVRAVLDHERQNRSRPSGAEVRFGFARDAEADPGLSRVEPVDVAAGGKEYLLRGQIDRIDLEAGTAVVVDYKFGRSAPYATKNTAGHLLANGERLQVPVYALAAGAMGAKEVSAAYLFVSPRDAKVARIPFDAERTREAVERFRSVLEALVEAAAAGDFLAKPFGTRYGERNCDACPVADVCGGGHVALYASKWEADGASSPLARLLEIG